MKSYTTKNLEEILDKTKEKLTSTIPDKNERELAALYVVMKIGYLTTSGIIDRLNNHQSTFYKLLEFESGVKEKKYLPMLEEEITKLEKEGYGDKYYFIDPKLGSHEFTLEAHNKEKGFQKHP